MLVCGEAGLRLDAGLTKVGEEIRRKSQALAEEAASAVRPPRLSASAPVPRRQRAPARGAIPPVAGPPGAPPAAHNRCEVPTVRLSSIVCAAVAAALAACAPSPETASMGAAPSVCRAAGAQALLGQQLTDAVLAEALRAAGGLRTRVVPPDAVVTMDHDPMRLNVEVDADQRIRRMRCG